MTSAVSLDAVALELGGRARVFGNGSVFVTGITQDSRNVTKGDMFVARRGSGSDGVDFASTAVANGATAVLVASADVERIPVGVPALVVEDVQRITGEVASAIFGHPSFTVEVVGVTGTNGKTTVTHLVAAALNADSRTCGVIGTVGATFGDWSLATKHTTPEPDVLARMLASMRDLGAEYVAIEVSSHALVQHRIRGVRLRSAALTNFTQDHLDFHVTMKAYRDAKASLFTSHAPGAEVFNIDDPLGKELAHERIVPTYTVSRAEPSATVYAERTRVTSDGIEADVRVDGRLFSLTSRLIGAHNLENLLVTVGIVRSLDVDVGQAMRALSAARGVPGRLERCDSQARQPLVLVDYAHTPDALLRALTTCRDLISGRLICVFGCGGDRDRTKRPLMGELAARLADAVIVTNDNPRGEDPSVIASEVEEGARTIFVGGAAKPMAIVSAGRGYAIELDREKAIDVAIASAGAGDCVLIAGKGHETYQIVGTQTSHFDDREVARAALSRHHGRR